MKLRAFRLTERNLEVIEFMAGKYGTCEAEALRRMLDSVSEVVGIAESPINSTLLRKVYLKDSLLSTTPKKKKKNIYKKKNCDEFAEFWEHYPKKRQKAKAHVAFDSVIKKTPLDVLVNAVEVFKASVWNDPQFIPYPATWLNQARWEEIPDILSDLNVSKKVEVVL